MHQQKVFFIKYIPNVFVVVCTLLRNDGIMCIHSQLWKVLISSNGHNNNSVLTCPYFGPKPALNQGFDKSLIWPFDHHDI
jgi:hypothetical protein